MVVSDSHAARCVSGGNDRSVADGEDSVDLCCPDLLHHVMRGDLWRFELHRDRAIAPRVFQLMATIGDVDQLHAELFCGFLETPRLITEFSGEQQDSFLVNGERWIHFRQSYRR